MSSNETYTIKPAGRHLLTIGKDLIQDKHAAIIELVKNSYDADSQHVTILFRANRDQNKLIIFIEDNGHGMTRDEVINLWLVPSTDDKRKRKKSPCGRQMQGSKGIGRYAASILGEELLLETTGQDGVTTSILINWSDFETAEYLSDVNILIESEPTGKRPGTCITITGNKNDLDFWGIKQISNLTKELKKLVSPVSSAADSEFEIFLEIEGIPDSQILHTGKIDPFPLFDLFDYRISGKIYSNGKGILEYATQKAPNTVPKFIDFDNNGSETGCGDLFFDIRVYDREKEAIETLIKRGLRDSTGNYLNKLETRRLINDFNGIGVFRNGFRIRPLGDAEFDWLTLNERRVQNPSMRIGGNQTIGYVAVASEEQSGLIEKSARDGLIKNDAYSNLKSVTREVIAILEKNRFIFRRKEGLVKPDKKIARELETLYKMDALKKDLFTIIKKVPSGDTIISEIDEAIKKEENNKLRLTDSIAQASAVYQSQATLGKITSVILHESRRLLNYYSNKLPRMDKLLNILKNQHDATLIEESLKINKKFSEHLLSLAHLFKRIDPLAATNRERKKHVSIEKAIQKCIELFDGEMKRAKISASIDGEAVKECWEQDIIVIFTNLIENSIFWLSHKKTVNPEISIHIIADQNGFQRIEYRDNGPGINPEHIRSEVIFEPTFSTKPENQGTGLGLAIAYEAALRNNLKLFAEEDIEAGVLFVLQKLEETQNGEN